MAWGDRDQIRTKEQILAQIPGAFERYRASGGGLWQVGKVVHQALRDFVFTVFETFATAEALEAFVLTSGERDITGPQKGVAGSDPATLTTLGQVHDIVNLRDWQESVKNWQTDPPESAEEGDRYLVKETATGDWAGNEDDVAVFEDEAWAFYSPQPGWALEVEATGKGLRWNGAAWVGGGTALEHDDLSGTSDSTAHSAFPLLTGERPFTGAIEGVEGETDASLTTRGFVEEALAGVGGFVPLGCSGNDFQMAVVNPKAPNAADDGDLDTPFLTIQGAINAFPAPSGPQLQGEQEELRRSVILIAQGKYDEALTLGPAMRWYLIGLGAVQLGDGVGQYFGSTTNRPITWNVNGSHYPAGPEYGFARPSLWIGTLLSYGTDATSTHLSYMGAFQFGTLTINVSGDFTTKELHFMGVKCAGIDGSSDISGGCNAYLVNSYIYGALNHPMMEIMLASRCEFDGPVTIRRYDRIVECEFDGTTTVSLAPATNLPPKGIFNSDLAGTWSGPASSLVADLATYKMALDNGLTLAGGATWSLLAPAASATVPGTMSAADYSKLAGLPSSVPSGIFSPAYGGMDEDTIGGVHADISCAVQGTWYPWINAGAESLAQGVSFTSDDTNGDYLEVAAAGVYEVSVEANFTGSSAQVFEVAAFLNADASPFLHFEVSASGSVEIGACNDLVSLAANDKIRVRVRCTSGAAKTFTVHHLEVWAKRIA